MDSQALDEIAQQLSLSDDINFARPRKFNENGEIIESAQPTSSEKKLKLIDLLTNDPALFLEKYGKLLTKEQLDKFSSTEFFASSSTKTFVFTPKDNYEIAWHLRKLYTQIETTLQQQTHNNNITVRNRRFKHLQLLISTTDYFSEENMKIRAPVLYHQYIGQYKTPSDVNAWSKPFDKNSKLYDRLLLNSDLCQADATIQDQMQEEEESDEEEEEEEEDDDDDDDDEEEIENKPTEPSKQEVKDGNGETTSDLDAEPMVTEEINANERYDFEEFLNIMKENFLEGKDHDFFDYSKVDRDESLDDLREEEREAEERYFDAD